MQGKACKLAALWYCARNELMVFSGLSKAPEGPGKLQQTVPKFISFFLAKYSHIQSIVSNEKQVRQYVPSLYSYLLLKVVNISHETSQVAQV